MTEANETNGNDQSDPSQSQPMPLHMLLETSQHSNIEHAIHNVMRKNFLEQRSITWKPIRVELVVNQSLTSDFFAIRKKFELASNGNRCEFDERYAFLIDNDQQVSEICRNGYQCTETSFNVLGHSKYGVYVCKYADVCIRRASVRRTWEGNMAIKMIIFKIVEGKQTAALVRKGPKLQPIAPTPQFTSHCSVITPKETDDLEKQFDQSQIFLYEFDGRETLKRPHHCLPYAVVSLIQNGSEWPANFDELDVGIDLLDTDTLRVVAQADDPLLKSKLQENSQLAEAATAALEHTYQEEPAPPTISDHQSSPASKNEINGIQNASDSQTPITSTVMVNGSSVSSSDEHSPKTSLSPSSSTTDGLTNHVENGTTVPPPPPPPPPTTSSSTSTSPANVPSSSTVTSSTPVASTIGAIPAAAYRQQASVLGAMPAAAAIRAAPGAVYATAAGLTNGLGGQIIYGGIPIDALRGYPGAVASPYALAAQAGQALQQPALFAAQLQALAQQQQQQQQAAQFAAAVKQQQQQQSLMSGIPAGYALVRTANGGLALLAQGPQASAAATTIPAQTAVQQSFITLNAAGQPTATAATAARLPMAMVGGQPQQIIYQYAGQPGLQAAPTQYIQLPANYAQQSGAVGNAILSGGGAGSAAYGNQTQIQYLATSPTSNTPTGHATTANVSSVVPSSSASSIQAQAAQTLISPQKQSAATATAAAIQQQQQYQFAYAQQQQQATTNGTAGTNPYHTTMSQAQAQQQQQQLQAAALAQQQQQYGFVPQIQYAAQQAVPQQVYYAPASGQTIYQAGGQSYILASAAPSTASATSTGAPIMYSSGPVLHNGAAQQQQQQQQQQAAQSQQQQQQQQMAYQILSTASHHGQPTSSSAGPGVVAQQPPQLIQRTNVVPQVRHHPYRN